MSNNPFSKIPVPTKADPRTISVSDFSKYQEPDWIRNEAVLSSHRSALLYKDMNHYGKFGWSEEPAIPVKTDKKGNVTLPYVWTA